MMDFDRVMVSFDDATLLRALMELKQSPDWPADANDDARLAEWDRIADAMKTINLTMMEFQDVVTKHPHVMVQWLAVQLRIAITMIQKFSANPLFAQPTPEEVAALRESFEHRHRTGQLHAVEGDADPAALVNVLAEPEIPEMRDTGDLPPSEEEG